MKCDFLQSTLIELARCQAYGNGALVDTTCLYPSGKVVQVLIQQASSQTFLVSDSGAAIEELELSGVEVAHPDKFLKAYARKYGVKVESGALFERGVTYEDIPAVIRMVANASQDAVARELAAHRFRPHREIRELFSDFIERNYRGKFSPRVVEGKNRRHLFDFVHATFRDELLIVDPVLRDASSMNAHIVAHLDVRAAHENVVQFLIYDDQEDWTSDQLGMLGLAAQVVSFQRVPEVLQRNLGLTA